METITSRDRGILRELAARQLAYAHAPENEVILKKWDALAHRRRESPTVRLLFSNFPHEVVTPRMRCEGDEARRLEYTLLSGLVGRELFDDDTPIDPFFRVYRDCWVRPFGAQPHLTRATGPHAMGFHIDPVITDLEADFEKIRGGTFGYNEEKTRQRVDLASDVFGDILPVRLSMASLTGAITNPLVHLMGMETYYCSMYDYPEKLHEAMDLATGVYERYYDFLEEQGLLLPTAGASPVAQESFAFNSELPSDTVKCTTDCWGFLESQETTAVSPETFGEFVFPYQDRLVRRFGLLSYGCCERVDAIWEGYLSRWNNLRKLSVSPFNNEEQVGEYLRGTDVVYYSKPRAEFVTNPGPLDEEALRAYFKGVCRAASGCLFEMAQREVGTIFGDFDRGRRYVQIARECIEEYWRP